MNDSNSMLLVVDDEPHVLKSIKRLFFDTGYTVLTAESGAAGLELCQSHALPVVISDYRMPGMNGVEFLSEVKRRFPNTVRMILSGYADASAIVEAINDGQVYKFIAKPWNDQDLLTTVMRAFEQHRLERENALLYEQLQQRNAELERFTKSLEDQVAMRTHDLEMRNRALRIAHNVLNLLPAGVIGVDSTDQVVYVNQQAKHCIGEDRIALGQIASDILPPAMCQAMRETMDGGAPRALTVPCGDERKIVVCAALPDGAGAVGLILSERHMLSRTDPLHDHSSAPSRKDGDCKVIDRKENTHV